MSTLAIMEPRSCVRYVMTGWGMGLGQCDYTTNDYGVTRGKSLFKLAYEIWDTWDLFGIYGIYMGFMGLMGFMRFTGIIWDSWD